jgi:hypothetical protein
VSNIGAAELRLLAERIAAGSAGSIPELDNSIIHQGLVSGFGWVILYGGIGVWITAAISFTIFNARSLRQAEVQCPEGS